MVVVFPSAMVVSSQEFCVSNREKKFSNLQSVDFVVRKRAPPTSNNIIESSILNTTFVLSVRVNYSRGFFLTFPIFQLVITLLILLYIIGSRS